MKSIKKKYSKNYHDVLPIDSLAKIIFYLPEPDREQNISKMPEFKEALKEHAGYLRKLAAKALTLVEQDKDLKAAAALVEKHRALVSTKFAKTLVKWIDRGTLESSTLEVAQLIHASAKEIDPTCIVGTRFALLSEVDDVDSDDDDYDNPDDYDWKHKRGEYVKVIRVKFGDITVHFYLQCHRSEADEEEGYEMFACIHMHVYSRKIKNGKDKLIFASRSFSRREPREETYYRTDDDTFGQYGDMAILEATIVLGTALALAAGVGTFENAYPVSHCVSSDNYCNVRHILAVLSLCGRSVESGTPKKFPTPPLIKALSLLW